MIFNNFLVLLSTFLAADGAIHVQHQTAPTCGGKMYTTFQKSYFQNEAKIIQSGQEVLTFELKACGNGHIGLFGDERISYEIVFGGYKNTRSLIR